MSRAASPHALYLHESRFVMSMPSPKIAPADCPEPHFHLERVACPICTWTEADDLDWIAEATAALGTMPRDEVLYHSRNEMGTLPFAQAVTKGEPFQTVAHVGLSALLDQGWLLVPPERLR